MFLIEVMLLQICYPVARRGFQVLWDFLNFCPPFQVAGFLGVKIFQENPELVWSQGFWTLCAEDALEASGGAEFGHATLQKSSPGRERQDFNILQGH